MRCDKKVVSVSAPQRARNEHKEVEALRRETVLSDNVLSRSSTGGAGVLERSSLWRELAEGKRENRAGHAFQAARQCVKLCTLVCQAVNGQERSVRGELIVKRLSTGRVQIVHWRVPTVNERNRRLRRRFFVGATKNLEADEYMLYHQIQ